MIPLLVMRKTVAEWWIPYTRSAKLIRHEITADGKKLKE
jgi:hypothetical protein